MPIHSLSIVAQAREKGKNDFFVVLLCHLRQNIFECGLPLHSGDIIAVIPVLTQGFLQKAEDGIVHNIPVRSIRVRRSACSFFSIPVAHEDDSCISLADRQVPADRLGENRKIRPV